MRTKNIFLAALFCCLASFAKAENVSIDDFKILQGDTIDLPINLTNSHNDLTAFSLTLTLPEGLELISAEPTDRYAGGITIGTPDTNVYNICGLDFNLGTISGTDGGFVTIKVAASKNFKGGEGTISEVDFITTGRQHVGADNTTFIVDYEPASAVVPGDVNGDGNINVLDVMTLISYRLGDPQDPFFSDNADVNGDGDINVVDIMMIIDIILNQ